MVTASAATVGRRRAGAWSVVAPVCVAILVGVSAAERAVPTLVVAAVVAAGIVLVLHVELAALAFVAIEPFESYLKTVSASGVKALGALVFAAWLLRVLSRARPARLDHPAVRAAAVLFAALLAATAVHPNGAAGLQVLTRYLSYLGIFVVLVDCMRDRLAARRVAIVYVASCTGAAIVGLVTFFAGQLRAGGPIGDPNDFAFFLVTAIPIALGLRGAARRPIGYSLVAVVMSAALLATLSRGALVGAAVMIGYVVLAGVVSWRRVLAWLALAAVAVAAILVVDPGWASARLSAKGRVAQQNVDERLVRWQAAAEMTADNPVLGLGPAGFRENFDRYVDFQSTDSNQHLDVAHEMYLETSAELGLPALVALVCFLAFGFTGARRAARAGPDHGLADGVATAVVGAAVAAGFLTEQYFLPVWLLAAFGAALDPRRRVT